MIWSVVDRSVPLGQPLLLWHVVEGFWVGEARWLDPDPHWMPEANRKKVPAFVDFTGPSFHYPSHWSHLPAAPVLRRECAG